MSSDIILEFDLGWDITLDLVDLLLLLARPDFLK